MLAIVIALLSAVVALGAWLQAHRRIYLAQYVFFLRYPIVLGCLLFAGPLVAVTWGKSLVGNLFVLEGAEIAAVTAMGFFAVGTAAFTFNLIVAFTYDRTKLPLYKPKPGEAVDLTSQAALSAHLARAHLGTSLVLLAPLAIVLIVRSPQPWYRAAAWVGCGLFLAGLAHRYLSDEVARWGSNAIRGFQGLRRRLAKETPPDGAKGPLQRARNWLESTFQDGFAGEDGGVKDWHQRAISFFLVSFALYLIGYPTMSIRWGGRELSSLIPVLVYLLLLFVVFGWLLAFLSFYFDKFRIPALTPLLVTWALSYVFEKDHYFQLCHLPSPGAAVTAGCSLTPDRAAEKWAERNSNGARKRPMIVVAASGGGISASYWTARVLTALSSSEGGLGPEFAKSIALVSSVSGGGVGAAYFVDAYRENSRLDAPALERIMSAAGDSSLPETAYAIAYHDVFRTLFPFAVWSDPRDRGWALEHSWRRWLSPPEVTLADWRRGVEQGWRPTHIFNVTIAETGEHLILGPFDCPSRSCAGNNGEWRAQSLPGLYGGECDLPVATAARLSATFPWITPLSRAPREMENGYHLADGGYYDNFGVVAAIEWLSSVHQKHPLAQLADKIIVVQVRASRDQHQDAKGEGGPLYASLGPLLTLSNVRSTSQRNHNDAELVGFKTLLWSQGVALETVEFTLDEEAPLSWHLTAADKRRIAADWDDTATLDRRKLLACLWDKSPADWPTRCGTEPRIELSSPAAPAQLFQQVRKAVEQPPIVGIRN
jgi:hypothetical protein